MISIGVVGFSRNQFDQPAARELLRSALHEMLDRLGETADNVELVSGLTNMGVPRIAYELADEMGMRTIGLSAKRALRMSVYAVDEQVIVGKNFGDESVEFIRRVDGLIRIGGGKQSRAETELFKDKLDRDPDRMQQLLIEHEVEWLGK
ncbi:MAG: hypothetical protein N2C14_30445 [Planctomycetales bacterium]